MERYVRVYGRELNIGDVVYYRPESERCAILRVECFDHTDGSIAMSALNNYVRERFIKSDSNGYYNFYVNYAIELYKKESKINPVKYIKEFKL